MTAAYDAEKLYFSSDLHLFHKAMLRQNTGLRPFTELAAMHEQLVENWNAIVAKNGLVFVLGDISFGKPDETMGILGQLNGRLHLVRGNHDKDMKGAVKSMFASVQDYLEIDAVEAGSTKQRICLLHYAMRVWNRSHYGSWNLHGHSHGSLPPTGKQVDVGLDAQHLYPVAYHELKQIMSDRPVCEVDHHKIKGGRA